jgi:hypothetical protein
MDPMNDLDRELARLLRVDPAADFAARVRTQIANQARPSRWRVPGLALSVMSCAILAALGVSLWPPRAESPMSRELHGLPHRNLAAIAPLRAAVPASPARTASMPPPSGTASDVLVSTSEMLALRRLFSGEIVAPPAGLIADELSIPQLAIDAIALPEILEGDQQ